MSFMLLGFGVFIIAIYLVIQHALNYSMEQQAVTVAEIVAIQATSARSVYARDIAKKLAQDGFGPNVHSYKMKGYVPIPAQFLKHIGLESSKNTAELFYYRPVSKWNLEPSQGLSNDFLSWAWPQLEQQDIADPESAINWSPVWRVETNPQGKRFLRYLKADPASSESCVNCHNDYEQTDAIIEQRKLTGIEQGKQWKLHQLLGALYVSIPLDKVEAIANKQNRETIIVIIIISILAIVFISIFIKRVIKQSQIVKVLTYQDSHDPLTGLINRRGFERQIDSIYEKYNDKVVEDRALCLINIIDFKKIIKDYGMSAADEILITIANTLKKNTRADDVVARLGGNKFGIIMNACSLDQAKHTASHIIHEVNNLQTTFGKDSLTINISVGLGMLANDSGNLDNIIDLINTACNGSSENGSNQIAFVSGESIVNID